MSHNNYHIKLNFCQLTLDELQNPFVHVSNGCQFNNNDNQQYFNTCPVCKTKVNQSSHNENNDKIVQDDQLLVQLELKNEKQIVKDKQQGFLYFMKRRNYTSDNVSKTKNVKELQQIFYTNLREKEITIEKILEISQQRNQQYISFLKSLNDQQKIPILMAVIQNKLVLFYHLYKLKVELNLLDVTNPKIRQKVGINTHGVLQQILFFENLIYFLYLKSNSSILFVGDFQQIFTNQNNQEVQFAIKSIPQFKLEGPAKLIQLREKDLLMLGNNQCFLLKQQTMHAHSLQNFFVDTLCHFFNNNQILMVNQKEYFCYDLSKPNFQQNSTTTPQLFNKFIKCDNYLNFGDQMVLFLTEELRSDKCVIRAITSWLPNTRASSYQETTVNVINHQSFMQPIKIISTQKSMNNITCQLIGLRLDKQEGQQRQNDEKDIFPALLVYNGQTSSFEVELI